MEFLIFPIDIVKLTISIWNLMTQKKESKHIIYQDANNLYGYAMPKFVPRSSFILIDPK